MIQVSRNCLQSGFNVVVSRLQIVIVSSNLCSFELDWSIVVMSNLARTLATVLRLSQRDILRFDCTKNRATPTRRKVMSNKNVNDSYARGGSKFLEQQKVTTKFLQPGNGSYLQRFCRVGRRTKHITIGRANTARIRIQRLKWPSLLVLHRYWYILRFIRRWLMLLLSPIGTSTVYGMQWPIAIFIPIFHS